MLFRSTADGGGEAGRSVVALRIVRRESVAGSFFGLFPTTTQRLVPVAELGTIELVRVEAIIQSMTPTERVDHNLLDGSRRRRIAMGSGTKVEDVNKLIKQFLEARKMMTRLTKMSLGKRGRMW